MVKATVKDSNMKYCIIQTANRGQNGLNSALIKIALENLLQPEIIMSSIASQGGGNIIPALDFLTSPASGAMIQS